MRPPLRLAIVALLALGCSRGGAADVASAPGPTVVLAAGPAGDPALEPDFAVQLKAWSEACGRAGARLVVIGSGSAADTGPTDRERLRDVLASEVAGEGELWLVLVGHGTFDGRDARFNLRGPDLSVSDLAEWLRPLRRPLALIHTGSASAPFLPGLAGPGRVIVTATRSGHEQNYARFGKHFAEAVADPRGDLDRDGQVSLLEAFLAAAQRTREFYKAEGRLATEHALLDDNGDGLGTPAEWFRGVLATRRAREGAGLDGTRAHQLHLARSAEENRLSPAARATRDDLERQLAELRGRKGSLPEGDYLRRLEDLLRKVAAVYAEP